MVESLAASLAEWFPELGGRSIAVSEVMPFKDKANVPTLPIAVTALVSETGDQSANGGGSITLTPDVMIMFMFEPVKYSRGDGNILPFFAFYDYEALRNKLLHHLMEWRTPHNGGISYRSLDVESDEFAVYISFRLRVTEKWCRPDTQEAIEATIAVKVSQPRVECCATEEECPGPVDPCDIARTRNPFGCEAKEET